MSEANHRGTETQSKTGRTRGVIFRKLRRFAARHKTFKPSQVRGMNRYTVYVNCKNLIRFGELQVARAGSPGRYGAEPIFTVTPALRAPEKTCQPR